MRGRFLLNSSQNRPHERQIQRGHKGYFDADENLVCERIHFDTLTWLRQLLSGINLKNPKNWPFVIRAVRGAMAQTSSAPDPRLTN